MTVSLVCMCACVPSVFAFTLYNKYDKCTCKAIIILMSIQLLLLFHAGKIFCCGLYTVGEAKPRGAQRVGIKTSKLKNFNKNCKGLGTTEK